jgi:cytidylate kinase
MSLNSFKKQEKRFLPVKNLIITISGTPGSGKTTIAKMLAKKLGLKHYSTGSIFRQIAKKKNLTPAQLNKQLEKNKSIDLEIDSFSEKLGKKEKGFVIDSRLAWYFIPHSIKIFLKVNEKIAAKRIFNDLRKEEKENTSLEKTLKVLRERIKSEKKRFKQFYGLNYFDLKNYDIVIDSTNLTIEQVLKEIVKRIKKILKEKNSAC